MSHIHFLFYKRNAVNYQLTEAFILYITVNSWLPMHGQWKGNVRLALLFALEVSDPKTCMITNAEGMVKV